MSPDESHAIATIHAVERQIEARVQSAIAATERTLAQRFGTGCVRSLRWILRTTFVVLVVAYFVLGVAILVARHVVLPNLDSRRDWLESVVGERLGLTLSVGHIESDWAGLQPRLKLTDVRLSRRDAPDDALSNPPLRLPQIDATLSWRSLLTLSPHLSSVHVLAPEIELRRLASGGWQVAGFAFDPSVPQAPDDGGRLLDWLLSQGLVSVSDARLRYVDARAPDHARVVELQDVQFRAESSFGQHRLALRATPPSELASSIDLRIDMTQPWLSRPSQLDSWSGRIYAETNFADIARIQELLPLMPIEKKELRVEAAQGALRLWLDFKALTPHRVTADVALADVVLQLGSSLPALALDNARGRLSFREFGNSFDGGTEYALDGFSMSGRGAGTGTEISLPPTRLRLRLTRATDHRRARGEFDAALLSLDQLATLAAHLPLGKSLRMLIERHDVRGELSQLAARWEGELETGIASDNIKLTLPARYSLQTQFSQLTLSAVAADPPIDAQGWPRVGSPGFRNLAGSVDLTQDGGSVTVEARDAALEFPGIFEDPRKQFSRLSSVARWSGGNKLTPARPLELRIDRLAAVTQGADITGSGVYRTGGKGPGVVDITARFERLPTSDAHRWLPFGVGAKTRAWLRDALQAGTASEGLIQLRGDLADFPYIDGKSGEFRVATRIRGATLDFMPTQHTPGTASAPTWPPLRDIDADFVLERNRIHIDARRASMAGATLSRISARVPAVNSDDVHLLINGHVAGPVGDMLRVVAESPVGLRLGSVFMGATASGEANGDLSLNIPLVGTAAPQVKGAFVLPGNDIALRKLPPFTRATGRIEFTERGTKLTDINAGFLGGQATISATTQSDGAIVFVGTGNATPAGVRRLIETPLVQRLLERAQGSARYSATVTLRGGHPDITVESDLTGWTIDAPTPLAKPAGERLPLRVALSTLDSQHDQLAIDAGPAFALRFEREHPTPRTVRVTRGVIRVADTATTVPLTLPSSGVRAELKLARLDFDRWSALLASEATTPTGEAGPARGGDGSGMPDILTAHVRELRVAGKPIANVVLGATRVAEGADAGSWQINAESDQASGALLVRTGTDARVSARLSRLTIPEAQRTQLADLLDAPATELPAFDVIAENFELGKRKLGRLELVTQNVARDGRADWQLSKLVIRNPESHLAATGQWVREPGVTGSAGGTAAGVRRMALTLTLDFSDGGALLTRLGLPGALRATAGKLEGDIAWRGSPFSLDLPSLSGALRLTADKGQFLKADAGVGRLLGVLSLQSLPRRLTLDFRDMFSEGFAFDSIHASAEIKNGVASTRDLKMRGVSATVLLEGSADLVAETQNLHVLVLPEINAGSASLVYALLANPAVGLGTFLAQLVLRDPLSKAFSFEYDVTGPWADPQVKRREKPAADTSTGTSTQ